MSAALPPPTLPAQPWRYLLPIAVLIYLLFVEARSPQQAGLIATVALILSHLAWPPQRLVAGLRLTGRCLLDATTVIADIVILAAAAALVVGVLNLTGLAFALTLQMLHLSGGLLAPLLLLAALLSIVLGLGMPTVGVYVLLSALAAPALIELGTTPVAAHLYLLYFGMLSMITPPIAIASFAAAAVADADPWRTAFKAVGMSAAVYLVPVAFVAQPALVLDGEVADAFLAFLRCLVAIALVTAAMVGGIVRPLGPVGRLLALMVAVPNLMAFGGLLPAAVLLGALAIGIVCLAVLARTGAADDGIPALRS
jgi:TRAP-type uncharacterized transport system fused permease subunit